VYLELLESQEMAINQDANRENLKAKAHDNPVPRGGELRSRSREHSERKYVCGENPHSEAP